jgi:toxin ParE2
MRVRILPAAQAEIEKAGEWYEAAARAGGRVSPRGRCRSSAVTESPNALHPLSKRLRRYRLHRFPYGIIYHARKTEILVIAVAHLHRRPEYWRHRLKGS